MKKTLPRVFLDSNVWFSAFYGSKNCEILLNAYVEKKIRAVISQQVLTEIITNIQEKIPLVLPYFQDFYIASLPEVVRNPTLLSKRLTPLIDPKDQPIYEAAVEAQVDYFVTGNIRDFQLEKLKTISNFPILTPKEATVHLHLV